jgi:KDO2-lipid IV(A) lauroyltransferase
MRENRVLAGVAVARTLGWLPRGLARLGPALAWSVYRLWAGCAGWACAIWRWPCPSFLPRRARAILRGSSVHLGWQLVEFCRMTRYTPENTRDWMRTEGLEHYLAAQARGKGVLVSPATWARGSFPASTTR